MEGKTPLYDEIPKLKGLYFVPSDYDHPPQTTSVYRRCDRHYYRACRPKAITSERPQREKMDNASEETNSEDDPLSSPLFPVISTPTEFASSLSAFLLNFGDHPVAPHVFQLDSGGSMRGIIATEDISPGQDILRVPFDFVSTAHKACLHWKGGLDMDDIGLTEHHILAIWLLEQQAMGKSSKWWPYIDTLPREFDSIPATWSSSPTALEAGEELKDARVALLENLPSCVVAADLNLTIEDSTTNEHPLITMAEKRRRMIATLREDWKTCTDFVEQYRPAVPGFASLLVETEHLPPSSPVDDDNDKDREMEVGWAAKKRKTRPGKPAKVSRRALDWDRFVWAWFCVNTRIFSLNLASHHHSVTMAMVAGADFLNHRSSKLSPTIIDRHHRSYDVSVTYMQEGTYSGCYTMKSNVSIKKGQETFNWYGRVGAAMGWGEWGFVPFVEASDDSEKPDRDYIESWDAKDPEIGGERVRLLPLPNNGLPVEETDPNKDRLFVSSAGPHSALLARARDLVLDKRGETHLDALVEPEEWDDAVRAEVAELIKSWCSAWLAQVERALQMVCSRPLSSEGFVICFSLTHTRLLFSTANVPAPTSRPRRQGHPFRRPQLATHTAFGEGGIAHEHGRSRRHGLLIKAWGKEGCIPSCKIIFEKEETGKGRLPDLTCSFGVEFRELLPHFVHKLL